jgi:hypothetical protein
MLDPGSNLVPKPDPELECITVPVPLRQKVAILQFRLLTGGEDSFEDDKNSCLWGGCFRLFKIAHLTTEHFLKETPHCRRLTGRYFPQGLNSRGLRHE